MDDVIDLEQNFLENKIWKNMKLNNIAVAYSNFSFTEAF